MVRFKIAMVRAPAISRFVELQVYKSTGDVKGARKMYEGYSEVSREGKKPWLLWGDIVIARKKLRTILVKGNIVLKNETMNLVQYDPVGLLQSWRERFPETDELDNVLASFGAREEKYWPC